MSGEIQLQITQNEKGRLSIRRVYHFHAGESFVVEPLDKHSILAIEDSQLVETITEIHNPKDTYV